MWVQSFGWKDPLAPGGGHGNPLQFSCLENPHGQRRLVAYSPWDHPESDMAEVTEHPKREKTHLVMRTLGTCSFNKFPIYHTVVLTVSCGLHSQSLLITGSLYSLINFFPITPSPHPITTPSNNQSGLLSFCMSLGCLLFRFHKWAHIVFVLLIYFTPWWLRW